MDLLKIALSFLKRDWYSGELRILIFSTIIAVTCVSAVNFFVDRVTQGMQEQSGVLLGGDLVLISNNQPPPELWMKKAKRLGLNRVKTVRFPSMAIKGDSFQLSSIKAVSQGYPLRGIIKIAHRLNTTGINTQTIPKSGEVWIAPRLLGLLNIKIGNSITIGDKQFIVSQLIMAEPDKATNVFTLAPRIIMNLTDLAQTNIIQPGSRIEYRWLFSGKRKTLKQLESALKPLLSPSQRIVSAWNSRPAIRITLLKAQNYFQLAALLSIILAGVAIAIAIRRYSIRHYDYVALMRCFGCSQAQIISIYSINYFLIGIASSLIGVGLGIVCQGILDWQLGQFFNIPLPGLSITPAVLSFAIGLVILIGFGLPLLLQLKDVPPLKVLRKTWASQPKRSIAVYLSGFAALMVLIYSQANEFMATLIILSGVLITVLITIAASMIIILSLRGLRGGVGISWRYGLANISRRWRVSMVQMVGFGLTISVLLLFIIVKNNFLNEWHTSLPQGTPNYFVINIAQHELAHFDALFKSANIKRSAVYPLVRGRLVQKQGQSIFKMVPKEAVNNNALHRALSLTWQTDIPLGNTLIKGRWWQPKPAKNEVSVEAKLARNLGLHIGDNLSFKIGARLLKTTITSIRTVNWASFKPNFYFILSPGALKPYPKTYITSFYLANGNERFLNTFIQKFPSTVLISIEQVMNQVRTIFDAVGNAIKYLVGFSLLAGVMVMIAAIQASLDERLFESATLRALGANKRMIYTSIIAEFVSLGALSGFLAAIGANITAKLIAHSLFDLQFNWSFSTMLLGPMIGVVIIGIIGTLSTLSVARQSPLKVLRDI